MKSDLMQQALESKAWPFQEARQLLQRRLRGAVPSKGYVLFETGYGPSGLPHIGTFAEVARTTMVRNAFALLAPEIPTRLYCFSDDMDGLRKVPENIPNKDMVAEHLGKPLTSVPDPFGTHDSFGAHNNARLMAFLDSFGFDYEFKSATACYRNGEFDEALLALLKHYDEVMAVILPTLGPERKATYSPFLPVSPTSGKILQVPILEHDAAAGTVVFVDEDGSKHETLVTGGNCKLQWKCDWAMRWTALAVDYEMSGKDLIDSVKLSSKICRILGGTPPTNLTYEMFLDEAGAKISKSKGNGVAVEEWLKYAPQESLAYFMYQKPKAAKRLHFDVIPRSVDDYYTELLAFAYKDLNQKLASAVWHIHDGVPPDPEVSVSYNMLLNLVSVCHSDDPTVIWHHVSRNLPGTTPETSPGLDKLIGFAIAYYKDFVLPSKRYRTATPLEREALKALRDELSALPEQASADDLQAAVYEIGKQQTCFDSLRDWFKALYEILLGQDSGPRMGSFIVLYGIAETIKLLDRALAGEDLSVE